MDIYFPFNDSDKMQDLYQDLYNELEDMFSWFSEDEGPEYKLKSIYVEDGKIEQVYNTKRPGTYVRAIIQKDSDCYRTIVEIVHEDEHKKYTIFELNYSYSKKNYFTQEDEEKIDDFKHKVYEQLSIFNPYMENSKGE